MFTLAELVGVNRSSLLRIERGDWTPSPSTMERLALALEHLAAMDTEELELTKRRLEPGSTEHLRDAVRYPDDEVTDYVTARHPDGLTGDQVAEVLGLSPRAVDTIHAQALAKLAEQARQGTPQGEDVREWMATVLHVAAERERRAGARSGVQGDDV